MPESFDDSSKISESSELSEKHKQILRTNTELSVRTFVSLGKLEGLGSKLTETGKIAVANISLHDLETAQRVIYSLINAKKDSIVDEDK